MNNQVANTKKETPSGIAMNDKDYMNSLLSCLKEMEKNYAIAMTEASNEALYQKYLAIYESIASLQRETYEVMFRNGWYVLERAEEKKIQNKYDTLSKEYQDLEI